MLLRSIRVENFRGVRCATVSFDPTTVLIGENDCGCSSLMEAVALVLGWDSPESEFRFEPFHLHRGIQESGSGAPRITIALEFGESVPGEWNTAPFEILRRALPDLLTSDRRFWFQTTHDEAGSRWEFRAADNAPLINDAGMLAWLRRRMPVIRMADGMLGARRGDVSMQWADLDAKALVDQVSQHYEELLKGTAPNVDVALEGGSEAARRLLLARMKFLPGQTTPMNELLEEITGRTKSRGSPASVQLLQEHGTAAHQLGLLLLVGALLRSGVRRVEQGTDPLTMIEHPEAHLHPMTLASIWSIMDRIRGQKIIATHSGALLASARLASVRRLTRHHGVVRQWRVPDGALNADELRRYSYHLRSRRAAANFARCWLLVEGETEFWLMDELARVCGYEFASEGVTCVEFAQCGLGALIKVAQHFGIEWHLLADGDAAGQQYVKSAMQSRGDGDVQERWTLLREPDVEHCFWRYGYQDVFRNATYSPGCSMDPPARKKATAQAVIARAIKRHSKPYLAVLLLDAVIDRGREGVPPSLRRAIDISVRLARGSPAEA
jgi:putative ATP-dependent endonuclease of OLD family